MVNYLKSIDGINLNLIKYLKDNIFPMYEKNDLGHNINHIYYVVKRSIEFASIIKDININMVITIAIYHDCAHHIDPKRHEIISSEILYQDKNLRKYFTEKEILIMKEAVEDHRASLEYEPRSIYGKIVSSADRMVDVDIELKRTFEYRRKRLRQDNLEDIIEESRIYLIKKYVGDSAKTKMFFDDKEYYLHIIELQQLVNDKDKFRKRYIKVNKIKTDKIKIEN